MPQHRKKPFSAKQKKKQLQDKRGRKREDGSDAKDQPPIQGGEQPMEESSEEEEGEESHKTSKDIRMLNQQPVKSHKPYDPNRYKLHFQHETREEIEQRKEDARKPLPVFSEADLEMDLESVYQPGTALDMPKRPAWNYSMSKEQLDAREERYIQDYLDTILEKYSTDSLSYFEMNLETWRQLWRVLEMSDIILLITDIRHPVIHFPPAFHDFVVKELGKPFILVLNKIDLAPPSLVVAWEHYFKEKYPNLHIIYFTSFPKDVEDLSSDPGKVLHRKRRRGAFSAVGPKQLLQVCESIVQGKVDLSSWREKVENELRGNETDLPCLVTTEENDGSYKSHEQYRDGVLTIGCCGYPNVGKSSLMNGLVNKKVVSVSKTPGHTKHFQTIFVTPTVKLCDSPGLVFPSLVPKPLQILSGIYPIAQVRVPYTAVGYLSMHIPLTTLLQLKHPEWESKEPCPAYIQWSAYDICDAWAEKRHFLTAKAARNDVYRAANSILRMAVDGRLCMCIKPVNYKNKLYEWEQHPKTSEVAAIQQLHRDHNDKSEENQHLFSETDSEQEEDEEEEMGANSAESKTKAPLAVSNPFALLDDDN